MMSYGRMNVGDDDQADGGYLATVSDLVAGLVFVFILMLAFFAYQLADVTEDLTGEGDTRRKILNDIKEALEEDGLRVEVLYEQGVLRLSENAVNFPLAGEQPISDHQVNVGHLARAVAEVVPCYLADSDREQILRPPDSDTSYCATAANPGDYECDREKFPWLVETLLIEGHTDDTPVRGGRRFRDNLELSSMRAATVYRMISACEPGMERFVNTARVPILSTSGYGATRPITAAAENRDQNRRIDLRFLLEPPEGALESASTPGAEVRDRLEEQVRR